MTEHDALLAAVLADPGDDLPRLVYADWLDDHGRPERAAFIRLQCELARYTCDFKQTPEQPGWRHDCGTDANGYWRCQPMRSRVRELFGRHKCEWFGERWAVLYPAEDFDVDDNQYPDLTTAVVRRGFVAEVRLPLPAYMGGVCGNCDGTGIVGEDRWVGPCHECGGDWEPRETPNDSGYVRGTGRTPGVARELFRSHPVERVVLTDREPSRLADDRWQWVNVAFSVDAPDTVPAGLFVLVDGEKLGAAVKVYPTEAAARDALGAAAVAYGRHLAASHAPEPEAAGV